MTGDTCWDQNFRTYDMEHFSIHSLNSEGSLREIPLSLNGMFVLLKYIGFCGRYGPTIGRRHLREQRTLLPGASPS